MSAALASLFCEVVNLIVQIATIYPFEARFTAALDLLGDKILGLTVVRPEQ